METAVTNLQVVKIPQTVKDPVMAAALDAISVGFDALAEAGLVPVDDRDAIGCVRALEQIRRRADAACVALVGAIERDGLFRDDGHGSAATMARHYGQLSPGEAAARGRTAKMLADLPQVADAYAAGDVGSDQVRLLGRTHANVRVRDKMVGDQDWFLKHAGRNRFGDFKRVMSAWVELSDADGAEPNERAHENRTARLVQEFDKTWNLDGSYSALTGAAMSEIFDKYIAVEMMADWEKARAEHGDAACADDLARTATQRRADALWQIFQDAANSRAGAVPIGFQHIIVWNQETFEHELAKLAGEKRDPLHPDRFHCHTINGVGLETTEAIANSLVSEVRRAVVDAKSTVIDLGEARFFTGNARIAAQLANTTCVWPGCLAHATDCEIDHRKEHATGGKTNPDNGVPLCGKHNRWKQKRFTIWRDPTGQWHTYRPDGTEIE